MMKKRYNFYLHAFIILSFLSLYYPKNNFISGSPDHWYYLSQVTELNFSGQMLWSFNLLSLYGFYPPYEEVGYIVMFTVFSQVTGLNFHLSLYFISIFLFLSAYFLIRVLAKEFSFQNKVANFSGVLFCTSPLVLGLLEHQISTRITLAIFGILPLILSMKLVKSFSYNFLLLLFISILSITSIHRSGVFIILQVLIIFFYKVYLTYFYNYTLNKLENLNMPYLSLIIFSVLALVGTNINKGDSSLFEALIFRGIELSKDLGFLIPFSILFFIRDRNSSLIDRYQHLFFLMIFLAIFFQFVVSLPNNRFSEPVSYYTFFFVLVFCIAKGIHNFVEITKVKVAYPILIILILLIQSSTQAIGYNIEERSFFLDSENSDEVFFEEYKEEKYSITEQASLGLYLKDSMHDFRGRAYYIPISQLNNTVVHDSSSPIFEIVKIYSEDSYRYDYDMYFKSNAEYEFSYEILWSSKRIEGFKQTTLLQRYGLNLNSDLSDPKAKAFLESSGMNLFITNNEQINNYFLVQDINKSCYNIYQTNSGKIYAY